MVCEARKQSMAWMETDLILRTLSMAAGAFGRARNYGWGGPFKENTTLTRYVQKASGRWSDRLCESGISESHSFLPGQQSLGGALWKFPWQTAETLPGLLGQKTAAPSKTTESDEKKQNKNKNKGVTRNHTERLDSLRISLTRVCRLSDCYSYCCRCFSSSSFLMLLLQEQQQLLPLSLLLV